ncbi:putative hydrolase or acyltransferase of alpha/beta superfamily [Xenococcus sp. PCC 7305]|uniref:alpha/beta fold hydrolase n=1 Tax=Xenococcus sp. PCC 7305 TaxID=102125 RepID=UPI0002AC3A9C|nr:alpha/beta hydrolase [Xenococcus sp. PCC 7305]ELS04433.1 putative hydrolase or acyltransferase of alpha/beta superfamily [Xenococcus sp. PCC 7305]
MSKAIQYVWISANPSLSKFDNRLIRCLSKKNIVARWEYYQNQDEPSSLQIALTLLTDYLKSIPNKVHLIGHGTGGLLSLLYTRKHPEKVKSLTLLGVGDRPAVDWQIHYYAMRALLPCSQRIVLAQMVQRLFGHQNQYYTRGLSEILKQDLKTSPSPHSLFRNVKIPAGGVEVPLMICGSKDDTIVDNNSLKRWYGYFKEGDILWEFSQGHHFFHYFYPQEVSRQILRFWEQFSDIQEFRNRIEEEYNNNLLPNTKTIS